MNNPPDRLTPFPILLSLAQDLLPSGPHPLEESLAHLLGDKATSNVDIVSYWEGRRKGVGSLFLTRVSGIDTRAVCPAAPALQLEILRIMS
jgi:hypothetical protein